MGLPSMHQSLEQYVGASQQYQATRNMAKVKKLIGQQGEEYRVVGQDFRDLDGDQVVVLSRIEGRGTGSGGLVDAAMGQIFDFRDGKIARVRTYLDHGEALEAAGLER